MAFVETLFDRSQDGSSEVFYVVDVNIEGYRSYQIELSFPNEIHPQNKSMHGGKPVTYAQLAGRYIKFGAWGGWMDGAIAQGLGYLDDFISKQVQSLVDEERKKARNEWNKALRTRGAKAKIEEFKKKREKLRKLIDEQKSIIDNPLPTLSENASYSEVVLFKTEMQKARAAVRNARAEMKKHRQKLSSLGTLKAEKARVATEFFSKDWQDAMVYTIEQMGIAEDMGNKSAYIAYKDQLELMKNPWDTAVSVKNAIQKAAVILKETIQNLFKGAKRPGLAYSTTKKRQYVGYDDTPLYETGALAESLEVKVK